MATIIKRRDIGGARRACETDGGVLRAGLIEIDPEDHIEAGAPKRYRNILGVVGRIGQVRRVRVGAIADDEGDARVAKAPAFIEDHTIKPRAKVHSQRMYRMSVAVQP